MTLPVLIISSSKMRQEDLINSLGRFDWVESLVIDGVDAKHLFKIPDIYDFKAFEYLNKRPVLVGELGCALAHLNAYKKIVENSWEWALVLEDNARIFDSEFEVLPGIIQGFSKNESLFKHSGKIIYLRPGMSKFVASKFELNSEEHFYLLKTVLRETKGYLINQSAAKIAVDQGLPIKDVADWPHWLHRIDFLVTTKDLIWVDRSHGTEIGIRPTYEEISGFKKSFRIIRLLKFISGYEYFNYRRNTGLKDYFFWFIRPRLIRIQVRFNSYSDPLRPTVTILKTALAIRLRSKLCK
jgi:hypothetical protein